jgi:hypothetical protein
MTVLVAHSSPTVRALARTVLTQVGYRVLDADTAPKRSRAADPTDQR